MNFTKYEEILDNSLNKSLNLESSFMSNTNQEDGYLPPNECSSLDIFNNLMRTSSLTEEDEEDKLIDLKIQYIQEEKKELPEMYTFDKMEDLLHQKLPPNLSSLIQKPSLPEDNIQCIDINISDKVFLGKKTKKRNKTKIKDKKKETSPKKVKEDSSLRKHNKFCADNIIKKIKRNLLQRFLLFVNKVINQTLNSKKIAKYIKIIKPLQKNFNKVEDILKIINYKYIDRLNKEIDLSMLNKPFKEIFSKDISTKYTKINSDSNKIIIQKLLEEEKDNDNLLFALNLKFREWLDIFTYKKDLNSIITFEKEKMAVIQNSFEYVDSIILDIINSNRENNYLHYFMMYLYNYERWFFLKKGRIRKRYKK